MIACRSVSGFAFPLLARTKIAMNRKFVLFCLVMTTLVGCTTTGAPSRDFLRVEEYYDGWQFIGASFTPGADVALSVYDAPVPCGTSYCRSGTWQPIGVVQAGPVGGAWPNSEGQIRRIIQRDEMASRRGVSVTCYPGASWTLSHVARDTVTGRAVLHGGATTSGYFGGLPRCR